MGLSADVAKRINPFMKSKGFRRAGGTFYYISEDIVYCVYLYQPTTSVYVHTYAMPLYVPCECRYLSYGNRVHYNRDILLPTLEKGSDQATIDAWIQDLCSAVEEKILPYFQTIGTPDKLVAYAEKERGSTSYIFCPTEWVLELKMYTQLYTGDLEGITHTISKYRRELCESGFSEHVIQMRLDDIAIVESLIHDKEAREAFIAETKANTRKFFK